MKAFTLRLPEALYAQSLALARKRGVSLNALVRQLLEEQTIFDAFTQLGEMGDTDVEFAMPAQSEVIRHD